MSLKNPPPLPPAAGLHCDSCQAPGPTRKVVFFRHIGVIVLSFHQHITGRFCRSCVNEHFANNTLVTSFLGWWGIKSVVVTPGFLICNIVYFLASLKLKPADGVTPRGKGLAMAALVISTGILTGLFLVLNLILRNGLKF